MNHPRSAFGASPQGAPPADRPSRIRGGRLMAFRFAGCALSWALTAATAHGADAVIISPDGRTTLRIAEDGATFTVARRGETVIAASPLGL